MLSLYRNHRGVIRMLEDRSCSQRDYTVVRYHQYLVPSSGMGIARVLVIRKPCMLRWVTIPTIRGVSAIGARVVGRPISVLAVVCGVWLSMDDAGCIGCRRRRVGKKESEVMTLDNLRHQPSLDMSNLDETRFESQDIWIMETYKPSLDHIPRAKAA